MAKHQRIPATRELSDVCEQAYQNGAGRAQVRTEVVPYTMVRSGQFSANAIRTAFMGEMVLFRDRVRRDGPFGWYVVHGDQDGIKKTGRTTKATQRMEELTRENAALREALRNGIDLMPKTAGPCSVWRRTAHALAYPQTTTPKA